MAISKFIGNEFITIKQPFFPNQFKPVCQLSSYLCYELLYNKCFVNKNLRKLMVSMSLLGVGTDQLTWTLLTSCKLTFKQNN